MGVGNDGRVHHINTITLMNNISGASSYTSSSLNINDFVLYAIQFSWTGVTVAGSVYTESSNDGTIWTVVDSFIPSIGVGSRMLNVEKAGYAYVRVRYASAAGTNGTFKAILNGKVD